jgi:hypothetical protein
MAVGLERDETAMVAGGAGTASGTGFAMMLERPFK